ALKAGQRAIALNNMREDAHRLVVRALAATGRKAEALRHYQDLVTLLKRELNTEPDAATKSLAADLRRAQPPSPPPVAVAEAGLASPRPASSGDEASIAPAALSGGLERRQLTIMVCNLVGSATAGLDPEEMHDLIAAFHKAVAEAVARFDGFVAQYLSNGVLVYFGYPTAHEDDAE